MLGVTHQLNSYFALNLCYPTHLPRIVLTLRSEISTWVAHQRGREGRGPLLVALVTPERTRCQSPMKGDLPPPIPTPRPTPTPPAVPRGAGSRPVPPAVHCIQWGVCCPGTLLQTGKLPLLRTADVSVTDPGCSSVLKLGFWVQPNKLAEQTGD